jgi:magnesium transporter
MPWYELTSADDGRLNELAAKYHLHPLHVEDARSADERIKVDQTPTYAFAVLKPIRLAAEGADVSVSFSTLDIFAGRQDGEPFFITIAEPDCPATEQALERARRDGSDDKPGRLLYLILDTIVDLYFPAIDRIDDEIDHLEDQVIAQPDPGTLQCVFALKSQLVDVRRVLVGTRDATLHLQRDPESVIDAEHQPFVRDIYDHLVRLLDSVETQRDLVNNSLDIYLSSVANRTNEVMKVLTVLGTIALPVIAVSGIYGMNLKGLPFENSPHGAMYVAIMTVLFTLLLLWWLKRRGWS